MAQRNPPWSRDELVLALDLYKRRYRDGIVRDDPEITDLSEILNALTIHAERPDAARFRNPNGIYMKMGNFAKQGMNMAMPQNMDMPPEGMERFTVDVTLAAGEGGNLAYSEKDFRFGGEGMAEVGPHRSTLGSGSVPAGGVVSGTINVQVPEDAENLTLSFDGGQPVALDAGGGDAEGEAGGSHGH